MMVLHSGSCGRSVAEGKPNGESAFLPALAGISRRRDAAV